MYDSALFLNADNSRARPATVAQNLSWCILSACGMVDFNMAIMFNWEIAYMIEPMEFDESNLQILGIVTLIQNCFSCLKNNTGLERWAHYVYVTCPSYLLWQFFDGCVAVDVPRSRFIPVRATSDLLLLQVSAYVAKERLRLIAVAAQRVPRSLILIEDIELLLLYDWDPCRLIQCYRLSRISL